MKKGQLPVESVSLLLPALLTLLSTFPQTVWSFSETNDKQQTRTSSACYLQRALTGFAPGTVYPHSWQETSATAKTLWTKKQHLYFSRNLCAKKVEWHGGTWEQLFNLNASVS